MTKFEPLAESEWVPESLEYRYLSPVGSSVQAVPSVPSDTPPVETVADVLAGSESATRPLHLRHG